MSALPVTVLKFGGSVLTEDRALHRAVHEIYRHLRRGHRVVAVVSAIKGETDRLLARARSLSDCPDDAAYAAFVGSGESTVASALALAADRAGIRTTTLDAADLGLETEGPPLDAWPARLRTGALGEALERYSLAVVPGFVGRCPDGRPTLLGRGGSDLTALFLATELGATCCRLIKDVDGWFVADPRSAGNSNGAAGCPKYAELNWSEAAGSGAEIVQQKAARWARRLEQPFEVGALGSIDPTRVGPGATRVAETTAAPPIRDVVVLGAGTVGSGVIAHLLDAPDRFRLRSVLVRDRERPRDEWIPRELLCTDPDEALAHHDAIVVELLGGLESAGSLVRRALERGHDVVSANKHLLCSRGLELESLAESAGATLRYSAAVGGSTPMLETVASVRRDGGGIRAFRGILNGTTNFILCEIERGRTFDEALRRAAELGFAEADPSADLSGLDAAQKLVLLLRRTFGLPVGLDDVRYDGLSEEELRAGSRQRLVARARLSGDSVEAFVGLEPVGESDPLAFVRNEWNALWLDLADGTTVGIQGRGAGRWPTAEAVLSDLLEASRSVRRPAVDPGGKPSAEPSGEASDHPALGVAI